MKSRLNSKHSAALFPTEEIRGIATRRFAFCSCCFSS